MKKYIGKFTEVDWKQIIANLGKGDARKYDPEWPTEYQNHKELVDAYKDISEEIDFRTFARGKGYEYEVDQKFANWLGLKPTMSWISEVKTGRCVPPHQDDHEINEVLGDRPKSNFIRYHCHISEPCMGSTLIVEKDCYHMEEYGAVYEWPDLYSQHCGFNAGAKPKYTYIFIGEKIQDDRIKYHHFY